MRTECAQISFTPIRRPYSTDCLLRLSRRASLVHDYCHPFTHEASTTYFGIVVLRLHAVEFRDHALRPAVVEVHQRLVAQQA